MHIFCSTPPITFELTFVVFRSLRAIVRALLVSGPPNTTSAFQKVVKQRLGRQRLADKSSLPLPSSLYASFNSRCIPYSSASSASSTTSLPHSDTFSSSSSSFSSPPSSSSSSPRLSTAEDLSASAIVDTDPVFTPHANELVARARALFGAGLGLASLSLLTLLINGTHGLRWSEDGSFVDALAVLDGDIAQAIQSSSEEVAQLAVAALAASSTASSTSSSGNRTQRADQITSEEGCKAISELRMALKSCEEEVEAWGGEFPFQRGLANVEWLEQSDIWTRTMTGHAASNGVASR